MIMQVWQLLRSSLLSKSEQVKPKNRQSGFTLLEMLAVMVIIGILTAISAPGLLGFTSRQRLRSDQGEIYRAIREAQSIAKRDKRNMQVSFRTEPDAVLGTDRVTGYLVHQFSDIPTAADWTNLETNVDSTWNQLNFRTVNITSAGTATENPLFQNANTRYYAIQFDERGSLARGGNLNTLGQMGYIVLAIRNPDGTSSELNKGCIFVDTILGGLKTSQNETCPAL
jgi:type II secretion system protein H